MNANVQKERPGSAPSTAWGRQWQFTLKELRETLRDRRTTVTLLAMPLLLYPLLGLGFRFVAWQQHGEQASEFLVAVETEAEARWLNDVLAAGQQLLLQELPGQDPSELSPRLSLVIPEDEATFDLVSVVSRREVDMGVRVTLADPLPDGAPQTARVELILCDGFSVGRDAADFVRDRLHRLNLAAISHWALQQNTEIQIPITEHSTVVPPQAEPSAILGLLPLILLLMTVTGGVYPAIDLTAGERERNTLETLMALPVPRFRILLAKFVAVFAVTMLTGLMNLVAMSVTVYALALETTLFGNAGLTAGLAIQLGFVLTVFALFYSALLLMLTSTARSFKEAQAYLIPLLLLSLAPGLVILLPGWSLHHGTAMVPLMNMLLVARALFEGEADPVLALLAIASTLLYALAALAVAAQTFGNEALSVGGQRRWRDLWKRPDKPERLPTADTAAVALAAMFPVYFLASGLLGRAVLPAGEHLMLSALLTILLFAVCPATLLYWQRVPIASGLSLSKPALRLWVAAIILGLATWPWIFEFLNVLRSFGIFRIAPQTLEQVEHLLILWQSVPLVLIVVSLGLIPGICEEIFFRGLLLSAIRRQLGAAGAVLATAVAFGLFHVVLAAAADRLKLPHSVHIHCNNLGIPGNWETTLHTMSSLEGRRGHLAHVQFHSYAGDPDDPRSFASATPKLVDYIRQHPNVTVDVGHVNPGRTLSMTGDAPFSQHLFRLTGNKWFTADCEQESSCGVIPIEYRPERSLIHAVQWAIALEWYLLMDDPWRCAMTSDHPNGGAFYRYPEIIALLMDRGLRRDTIDRMPHQLRERSILADIDRELTMNEIAIRSARPTSSSRVSTWKPCRESATGSRTTTPSASATTRWTNTTSSPHGRCLAKRPHSCRLRIQIRRCLDSLGTPASPQREASSGALSAGRVTCRAGGGRRARSSAKAKAQAMAASRSAKTSKKSAERQARRLRTCLHQGRKKEQCTCIPYACHECS